VSDVDLERYRRRAEEFVGALDFEYYEHFSGRKARCDTTAVYDRYPELFTREAIDGLEELYAVAKDDAKWRLAYLLAFSIDGYLGEQTKNLGDDIANTEGESTITVDGEAIGLRQAGVAQSNEPDRARRERIQAARLAATTEHLNPLLDAMWRRCHELAVDLGYPDYKELYGTVKGLDYDHLRAELETFLADTEGLYERVMDRLVRQRLGVTLSELSYADLPFLWRAVGFDHVFRADALLPSLRRTLTGMGIDLDAQPNVHLDTEVRPLKSPRAFCSPVRVPDEIYLCVLPQGGQDDFGMLLHEAGHTEHFAHIRPDLAFEYRHLGDNAVTEGFAFIFDHLLGNREWLGRILDYEESDEYVRFAAINDLYFMRRYAAKLSYEVKLHTQNGALDGMAAEYSRKLSAATKVAVPEENYLVDVDEGFYCASYLRAWMLEGALRVRLQDDYGQAWFASDEAGDWLKSLWSQGQQLTAERLLLRNGGGRLNADPIKHLFEQVLGR
jgi:hypothetical protein